MFSLQVKKLADDVHKTVLCPNVFPQIRCSVTVFIRRIACTVVMAEVKRKVARTFSVEPCGHVTFIGIYGKVNKRAFFKLENRLGRFAVVHILFFGIRNRLTRKLILKFNCGDRKAV